MHSSSAEADSPGRTLVTPSHEKGSGQTRMLRAAPCTRARCRALPRSGDGVRSDDVTSRGACVKMPRPYHLILGMGSIAIRTSRQAEVKCQYPL